MNSSKNTKKPEPRAPSYNWTYPDNPPGMLRSAQRQPDPFARRPLNQQSSAQSMTKRQRPPDRTQQSPTYPHRQTGFSQNTVKPADAPARPSAAKPVRRRAMPRSENVPAQSQRPDSATPSYSPHRQQQPVSTPQPRAPKRGSAPPVDALSGKKGRKKKQTVPPLLGIPDNMPSTRKQVRAQERLDPERLEIERRNKEKYRFYLKKRRKRFFRVLMKRFVLFVVIFTMLATLAAVSFVIHLNQTDKAPRPEISYKIGTLGLKTYRYEHSHNRGVLLVNFFDIADLCAMTISGTVSDLKFTVQNENGDSLEYVRFFPDSDLALINGQSVRLSAPARLISEELWVPADFLTNAMTGLSVSFSESGNRLDVTRVELNGSTPSNRKYETVTFLYKENAVINPIDESQIIGLEAVQFITDLSAYEKYMNPALRDDYLLLVNGQSKLASDYIPPDLIDIAGTETSAAAAKQLREYAAKSLEALLLEAQANGIKNLRVSSAYRSYANQNYLFNYYINTTMAEKGVSYEDAYKEVITYSAPAGTSEHQTGLAIDITSQLTLDQSFAQTEQYQWLSQNAHKFGFILRYPENKTDLTGIMFEPWHFRYVGRYHATRIHESGLCLEEYLDTLQR